MEIVSEQRVRTEARISINKLGEYLTAEAGRRRTILKDQKYPPAFQAARYADAEEAIVGHLIAGGRGQALETALRALNKGTTASTWHRQRVALCSEAIVAFRALESRLDLRGMSVARGPADAPKLQIAGVTVSVRPELIVTSTDGSRVGLLKLHMTKGEDLRLNDKSGLLVAALCHQFASEHLKSRGTVDRRIVQVLDVFGGRIYVAPVAIARRSAAIEAACEEIAARWSTL